MTKPTDIVDSFDPRAFRRALGGFATGVCVVTAHTQDGPLGITVNSFTSVSLDPPLVLWCVDVNSERHDAFAAAERFAVHMLPHGDYARSDRFARGPARLEAHEVVEGDTTPPRLEGAVTRLECVAHDQILMGDHRVIFGRVTNFETQAGHALTYFRGQYGQASDPSVQD